jgi:hypothetical protein
LKQIQSCWWIEQWEGETEIKRGYMQLGMITGGRIDISLEMGNATLLERWR